jgi:long-chain fatty acid transport protein
MWDLEEALNWGQGLRLGLAVNSPFGLATQYQEGWLGRYHALQSDLRTIAVNPMVALDVADGLSVGFGFQGQYIDAKLTNAIDFGTLGALNGVPGAIPTAQDGQAKVTGDDLGFGYNVGVLVEPWQGGRIGLAYRSAIRHQLEGDADFQLDNAGIGAALQAGSGAFADTGATAKVTTPETISLGLHQVVADDWSVMAEASWTRWDRFRTLRVKFENPAQPTSFTEEDWENTWFLAVGASWQTSDALTLRSGVSYEQSPVPNDKRTPRNPANDGVSLAVGASYRWSERLLVELSYIHTFLEDSTVDLRADDPGNLAAGNLSGNYDNAIDTCSVSIRWIF